MELGETVEPVGWVWVLSLHPGPPSPISGVPTPPKGILQSLEEDQGAAVTWRRIHGAAWLIWNFEVGLFGGEKEKV